MSQFYSDSTRESDPHALPDMETFFNHGANSPHWNGDVDMARGWYWQACFPGCLPDSDPCGPFATEAEAIVDAREGIEPDDEPRLVDDDGFALCPECARSNGPNYRGPCEH